MKNNFLNICRGLIVPSMLLATCISMFSAPVEAQVKPATANPYYARPVIVPIPKQVSGVNQPSVSLSGAWLSKHDTLETFIKNPDDMAGWTEVVVPQVRFARTSPENFTTTYKKKIHVPANFDGKRVIIRFDGVSHLAKLWVNGLFMRDHWGSIMAWTCDITETVSPGKDAWIVLTVDNTRKGLAQFVRGGGIQRDVTLFAVPANYIQRLHVETDFDDKYENATMQVFLKVGFSDNKPIRVNFKLKDKNGKEVSIGTKTVEVPSSMPEVKIDIPVKHPTKWDAEHPVLYTLEASIVNGTATSAVFSETIGFREVELKGDQLSINGMEVKFRGMWGGDNARTLRNMNVNHTRQKWATEAFLDSCDRLGVYVLDENPVDFAKYGAESDPEYTYQWMNFISDLMERDYNHPSVVMWGLGNESFNGDNVLRTCKYVGAEDPKRPTMFSWGNRIKTNNEMPYSVYSFHYPNILKGGTEVADFNVAIWHSPSLIKERKPLPEMPVILDEYAHVVLSPEEMKRDPNVRNFWGESIKKFWETIFVTKGALGGDQFGIFSDLDKGLPEPWLMRKAYSPIRIDNVILDNPGAGKKLAVQVKNWFDHTSLDEINISWQIGEEKGTIKGPKIAPHAEGTFELPARNWENGDKIELKFVRPDGFQVDEFILSVNPEPLILPVAQGPAPELTEDYKTIKIRGDKFEIVFDKYKGQIISGTFNAKTIITGGPHLQFERSGMDIAEYWCQKISAKKEQNEVVVLIEAIYSPIGAEFEVRIDGKGLITTNYKITHFPDPAPVPKTIPWDQTDIGGYSEVGVVYELSNNIDRLQWDRKSLWTVYPNDHIGRPEGIAYRNGKNEPAKSWSQENRDWRFTGISTVAGAQATNDFRSSKEYIRTATAFLKNSNLGLQALSLEKDAVRMEARNNTVRMFINNEWNYPTLGLGNYMKNPIRINPGYSNKVMMRFIESLEK